MICLEQKFISTITIYFNPFDIFEQFYGNLSKTGFLEFRRGPRPTRITNGAGSFSVFSSGIWGNSFFWVPIKRIIFWRKNAKRNIEITEIKILVVNEKRF